MDKFIKECIRRRDVKKFVGEFESKHEQFEILPTSGYKYFAAYRVYSTKVVKNLYILKRFIEKRKIKSDYELVFLLRINIYANHKFLKLINQFMSVSAESFVESLKTSVLDTAKIIQFDSLNAFEQKSLLKNDAFYKEL